MATLDRDRKFDLRTIERNVRSGVTSREEHREFLASLPDVSNNIRAKDDGGDEDGYDYRFRRQDAGASSIQESSESAANSVWATPPRESYGMPSTDVSSLPGSAPGSAVPSSGYREEFRPSSPSSPQGAPPSTPSWGGAPPVSPWSQPTEPPRVAPGPVPSVPGNTGMSPSTSSWQSPPNLTTPTPPGNVPPFSPGSPASTPSNPGPAAQTPQTPPSILSPPASPPSWTRPSPLSPSSTPDPAASSSSPPQSEDDDDHDEDDDEPPQDP